MCLTKLDPTGMHSDTPATTSLTKLRWSSTAMAWISSSNTWVMESNRVNVGHPIGQGVIRARKARSHVHTETFFEPYGHLRTQNDGHMYTPAIPRSHVHTSDATVTCTHHYSGYGVGWSDNVHVSVHAQARQPYHLSGCSADTGTTHPCVPLNYCLHSTSLFKLPPCVPL